jgi:hypothetical protein
VSYGKNKTLKARIWDPGGSRQRRNATTLSRRPKAAAMRSYAPSRNQYTREDVKEPLRLAPAVK